MEYIVYFECDRQIVQLAREDVFLGEYENFSWQEWEAVRQDEMIKLKAVYNEDVYDAWLLQVIAEDIESGDSIQRFRSLVTRKKLSLASLLKAIPRTRHTKKRTKLVPLNVSVYNY